MNLIKLNRYLNLSLGKSGECLDYLLTLHVEVILTFVSGLLSQITSFMCYKNVLLPSVRLVIEDDVILVNCFLLVVVGFISLSIAVVKASNQFSSLTFNKYLLLVVMTMFFNFIIVMTLTDYKSSIIDNLDNSMLVPLNRTKRYIKDVEAGDFTVHQAWNNIQMKLLCCGVHGYQDYIDVPKPVHIENVLPLSCCSKRSLASLSSPSSSSSSSSSQCYLDAVMGVYTSSFLHTQGCHGPVTRWMVRLINKMSTLVYVSMVFQAFTILYLSFLGYKKVLKL